MTLFIGQSGPDTFLGTDADFDSVDDSGSTDGVSVDLNLTGV